MKTTQAIRKTILAARAMISWFLMLEAINRTAHTTKRIQPKRMNFTSRFLLYSGISLTSF
jgi:hypothetical protein